VIEKVAFAFGDPRAAPGTRRPFEAAKNLLLPNVGEIVHVSRWDRREDIKSTKAVAGRSRPQGGASMKGRCGDAGFFGDVLELAVAEAVIMKRAATEAG